MQYLVCCMAFSW